MIRGSCLCGGVRFEIDGPVGRASHCHCSMCRKAHGAAFGTYGRVERQDFRWTAGEKLVARFRSSPEVTRTFCSRCGSTLQWLHARALDRMTIALGVLDDDPWYEITDDLEQRTADG